MHNAYHVINLPFPQYLKAVPLCANSSNSVNDAKTSALFCETLQRPLSLSFLHHIFNYSLSKASSLYTGQKCVHYYWFLWNHSCFLLINILFVLITEFQDLIMRSLINFSHFGQYLND